MSTAIVLLVYVFLAQFVEGLYAVREIEMPYSTFFLSRLAFVWLVWWWLREDSRRRGVTWMLDLGMFLMIAWPLLLLYHLFKTRGWAGLIPILWFILALLCGSVAAAVTNVFILP